jgi:hypothetical protein
LEVELRHCLGLGAGEDTGIVKEAEYGKDADVQVKVCGLGTVEAYSSMRPTTIALHSEAVELSYDNTCGLVLGRIRA